MFDYKKVKNLNDLNLVIIHRGFKTEFFKDLNTTLIFKINDYTTIHIYYLEDRELYLVSYTIRDYNNNIISLIQQSYTDLEILIICNLRFD